jgi:hypothetical protein
MNSAVTAHHSTQLRATLWRRFPADTQSTLKLVLLLLLLLLASVQHTIEAATAQTASLVLTHQWM